MKINFKTIIIIAVILIVIVFLFYTIRNSGADDEQKNQKKASINSLFAIWLSIVGEGDKRTMLSNEGALKNNLYDTLGLEEIKLVEDYSANLKTFIDNKKRPFSAEFIGSLAYLTQNFNSAKETISKTDFKDIFLNSAKTATNKV